VNNSLIPSRVAIIALASMYTVPPIKTTEPNGQRHYSSGLPVFPSLAGRNDPCPCGSGQKYKRCHFGKSITEQPTHEAK
jgi:uncharacterized protein YecA (UPF0149 family)